MKLQIEIDPVTREIVSHIPPSAAATRISLSLARAGIERTPEQVLHSLKQTLSGQTNYRKHFADEDILVIVNGGRLLSMESIDRYAKTLGGK